jgi:hypothetical protein
MQPDIHDEGTFRRHATHDMTRHMIEGRKKEGEMGSSRRIYGVLVDVGVVVSLPYASTALHFTPIIIAILGSRARIHLNGTAAPGSRSRLPPAGGCRRDDRANGNKCSWYST